MKGNTNIEDLFKQKFDNFQPDVNPDLWANIQAGISAGTATTTGISIGAKIGLISGGIIAASAITWYLGFYEPQPDTVNTEINQTEIAQNHEPLPVLNEEPIIVVDDTNDPVIIENKEKIERHLRDYQVENGSRPDNSSVNPVQNNSSVTQTVVQGSQQNTQSTTNNGSVNNGNNSTQVNKQDNNSSQTNNTSEENTHKERIPSGRMEFTQGSAYAPSAVNFVSNALNFKEVRWDFGDGTTIEGTDVKHTFAKPGNYSVRLTVVGLDKTNYEETREVVVKSKSSIDNVPNVITPNGDRINDYFSVKSTDLATFYISIRDSHGDEVFSSNDKDFVWDGTDQSGNPVDKGHYTYLIIAEGTDGSVIKLPGQIYVE